MNDQSGKKCLQSHQPVRPMGPTKGRVKQGHLGMGDQPMYEPGVVSTNGALVESPNQGPGWQQ